MSGKVELGRAYAAFREREGPSADERAATWEAIQARIARGETGPALPEPPLAAPARKVGPKTVAAAVLLAAAAVVALALPTAQVLTGSAEDDGRVEAEFQSSAEGEGGKAVVVDEVEPQARRIRPKERARDRLPQPIAPAPIDAALPPAGKVEIEVEEPPPEDPEPIAERRRRPKPPPPAADPEPAAALPPAPPALQVQARLLQDARTALARHQPRVALAAVREHARRFPETSFARERAALELLAQCELGRASQVRTRVDAFLGRNAGTALADRVDRACRR